MHRTLVIVDLSQFTLGGTRQLSVVSLEEKKCTDSYPLYICFLIKCIDFHRGMNRDMDGGTGGRMAQVSINNTLYKVHKKKVKSTFP